MGVEVLFFEGWCGDVNGWNALQATTIGLSEEYPITFLGHMYTWACPYAFIESKECFCLLNPLFAHGIGDRGFKRFLIKGDYTMGRRFMYVHLFGGERGNRETVILLIHQLWRTILVVHSGTFLPVSKSFCFISVTIVSWCFKDEAIRVEVLFRSFP